MYDLFIDCTSPLHIVNKSNQRSVDWKRRMFRMLSVFSHFIKDRHDMLGILDSFAFKGEGTVEFFFLMEGTAVRGASK